MKTLAKMAWHNLFRYRRRTVITLIAIAVGISLFVVNDSLLSGLKVESIRNLKWYETGSGRFLHPEWWENRQELPLEYTVAHRMEIEDYLDEEGIHHTARIAFTADMVIFDENYEEKGTLPTVITAIDPESDSEVFKLSDGIVEGDFLKDGEDSAVIGQWLAEDLDIGLGTELTLITRTREGFFETMDLTVTGIFVGGDPQQNRNGVFIPLDTAQEALQMNGEVTHLFFRLPEGRSGAHKLEQLRQKARELDGVTVMDWQELAYDFIAFIQAKTSGSVVILFLVFLIAGVGITNTMLMAIFERIREQGLLRALGMEVRDVRRLFVLEAVFTAVLGTAMGLALGLLINIPLVVNGLDFGAMMRDSNMGFRVLSRAYGTWKMQSYILALVGGIGVSSLIAFGATKRLKKWTITDCLRNNKE